MPAPHGTVRVYMRVQSMCVHVVSTVCMREVEVVHAYVACVHVSLWISDITTHRMQKLSLDRTAAS